jgi:endonuclease YncB( thermonuclease family)
MMQFCFFAMLALMAVLPVAARADVMGSAVVVDGDTIEISGQRIRLHGIDAPESDQLCEAGGKSWRCGQLATLALSAKIAPPESDQLCEAGGKSWRCGQLATLALSAKIARRPVSCTAKDVDRYQRLVAVCFAGNDELNGWMVAEGWALAYLQLSSDYADQEHSASAAKKGVWRGSFVAPWDWRVGKRNAFAGTPENTANTGGCVIKGNISSAGERIYHVPGGVFYDATRIDTAHGEHWFCTEADASAAGWRRSLR